MNYDIYRMCADFGILPAVVKQHLIKKELDELKELVKKAWKKLAFDNHPDRGGDEEKFKMLNELNSVIQSIQIVAPRPVVSRVYVWRQPIYANYTTTSSTTTSSTTTGW